VCCEKPEVGLDYLPSQVLFLDPREMAHDKICRRFSLNRGVIKAGLDSELKIGVWTRKIMCLNLDKNISSWTNTFLRIHSYGNVQKMSLSYI
jgi:hypothetical protein